MENEKEVIVSKLLELADDIEHSRTCIPLENKQNSYVQGSLRKLATHVSKADPEMTYTLSDKLKDAYTKQRRKGIAIGKAVGYRNCLITMCSIAAVASGMCLAIDIYQAIEFAINEQNKTNDHREDGDQKE